MVMLQYKPLHKRSLHILSYPFLFTSNLAILALLMFFLLYYFLALSSLTPISCFFSSAKSHSYRICNQFICVTKAKVVTLDILSQNCHFCSRYLDYQPNKYQATSSTIILYPTSFDTIDSKSIPYTILYK